MDAKEYLLSIKHIETRIRTLSEEVQKYNDIATKISATIDGDKVQSSMVSDKLGNAVAKIVDLEIEIKGLVDELIEKRRTIVKQIDSIENANQRDVLYMRYVTHLHFEEIAEVLGFSKRHTLRVHGYALKNFSKKYKKSLEMSLNVTY